ncbi:MAG: type IV toxin-antitoxin system AbiEi family antitoxin domain-containing protein [Acidimicrobiales bacterium]
MYPSLRATAKAQMALFTLEQARAAGYSPRQVQYRRETGEWDQVHPSVYCVAGVPDSWERRLLAASLAAGPGAVASHRAAARVWGVVEADCPTVELSVPPGRTHRLEGVVVHRSTDLLPFHVVRKDGLAVTTPARTILDLGSVRGAKAVERALDLALSRRLVTLNELRVALDFVARRGRRGAGVLRSLLDERSAAAGLAESVLEARMLRLCRQQGLPEPVCQHEVRSGARLVGRIDFAYVDHLVAIELDGYESHSSLDAFRRDRARQNDLVAMGWTVLRFTWDDVTHHPARVAHSVLSVLRAQSNTGC